MKNSHIALRNLTPKEFTMGFLSEDTKSNSQYLGKHNANVKARYNIAVSVLYIYFVLFFPIRSSTLHCVNKLDKLYCDFV